LGREGCEHIFEQKNVNSGFKVIGIWLFDPKAMDENTRPNEIYITIIIHISKEENDSFDATIYDIDQWGENGVSTQLLNITTIVEGVWIGDDIIVKEQPKIMYYVEMPNSLIVTQKTRLTEAIYVLIDNLVDGPSCEVQCYQRFANDPRPFCLLQISYYFHIYLQGKQ